MKPLQIIGCGPGGMEFLSQGAIATARLCSVLTGAPHLLNLFSDFTGEKLACPSHSRDAITLIESLLQRYTVAEVQAPIGVLVSGDVGLCSLATPLLAHFGLERCQLHAGISSVQVACARLGLAWEQARIVSAHAQLPGLDAASFASDSLLVVLGGSQKAQDWCAELATQAQENSISAWKVHACCDLGLATETIFPVTDWSKLPLRSRTVFVLQRNLP